MPPVSFFAQARFAPSSFFLRHSMSFLPRCTSAVEAAASFQTHGAAILAKEGDFMLKDNTLADLYKWCDEQNDDQQIDWKAWIRSDRHMNPNVQKDWNRFTLNCPDNWKRTEWQQAVAYMSRNNGVLAVVQLILGVVASITRLGGDTVRGFCKAGQCLHSDGGSVRSEPGAPRLPFQEVVACPFVVLSICVHDISKEMGAFYFVGLDAMYSVDGSIPPVFTPEEFDTHFGFDQSGVTGCCVMRRGDMLLRNPLVWHAGTPNCSGVTRYLPGCIFEASRN